MTASLSLLAALLLSPSAHAGAVVFSEDFSSYSTVAFATTVADWDNGYVLDPWAADGDVVYATTDATGGSFGSTGAKDNHLVYTGDSWGDQTLDLVLYSDDNDTIGVVFRFQDASNYYALFLCDGGSTPATAFTGARLYVVSGGIAGILATSTSGYTAGEEHAVRIIAEGSDLSVWFDVDYDGIFDSDEEILTATDSTFTEGYAGFYCYDNGYGDGRCAFDDLVVTLPDTDEDGVADEDDNCPDLENADQADLDGDELGDACDDDADGDGHDSLESGGLDCDDTDADVSPDGVEHCDGVDEDCDDLVDEDPADGITLYADTDGDTYGDDAAPTIACEEGDGLVVTGGDCDDTREEAYPGADEVCNDLDDDCDLEVDEGLDTMEVWVDGDGDGFGDQESSAEEACDVFDGMADNALDCDDGDAGVNPAASEEPGNGVDEDCDGIDDPGESSRKWTEDDAAAAGSGCGCASTGVWLGPWWLLALVGLRRR